MTILTQSQITFDTGTLANPTGYIRVSESDQTIYLTTWSRGAAGRLSGGGLDGDTGIDTRELWLALHDWLNETGRHDLGFVIHYDLSGITTVSGWEFSGDLVNVLRNAGYRQARHAPAALLPGSKRVGELIYASINTIAAPVLFSDNVTLVRETDAIVSTPSHPPIGASKNFRAMVQVHLTATDDLYRLYLSQAGWTPVRLRFNRTGKLNALGATTLPVSSQAVTWSAVANVQITLLVDPDSGVASIPVLTTTKTGNLKMQTGIWRDSTTDQLVTSGKFWARHNAVAGDTVETLRDRLYSLTLSSDMDGNGKSGRYSDYLFDHLPALSGDILTVTRGIYIDTTATPHLTNFLRLVDMDDKQFVAARGIVSLDISVTSGEPNRRVALLGSDGDYFAAGTDDVAISGDVCSLAIDVSSVAQDFSWVVVSDRTILTKIDITLPANAASLTTVLRRAIAPLDVYTAPRPVSTEFATHVYNGVSYLRPTATTSHDISSPDISIDTAFYAAKDLSRSAMKQLAVMSAIEVRGDFSWQFQNLKFARPATDNVHLQYQGDFQSSRPTTRYVDPTVPAGAHTSLTLESVAAISISRISDGVGAEITPTIDEIRDLVSYVGYQLTIDIAGITANVEFDVRYGSARVSRITGAETSSSDLVAASVLSEFETEPAAATLRDDFTFARSGNVISLVPRHTRAKHAISFVNGGSSSVVIEHFEKIVASQRATWNSAAVKSRTENAALGIPNAPNVT